MSREGLQLEMRNEKLWCGTKNNEAPQRFETIGLLVS